MNRTNIKERGISILVSLFFHFAVLFLLIKVVPPVRVNLYRQVADVKIVSPEMMFFPRIDGSSGDSQTSGVPPSGQSLEEPAIRMEEDLRQATPDPGIVYLRNLNIGRDMERSRDRLDFSETIPRFDLVPSPKSKGGFSLEISRRKSESEETVEKEEREDLDLSKYNSPALASLRFDRITTHKEKGDPTGRLSRNVLDSPEGYDITPWVKEVVDKIRNNWTLPPIDESIAMGEVKIFIIIGKQGNLVAMEIEESSDFQVFDQTTAGAIRSSAPFPPLPDDFPFDRMEAYLVFQFNE